MFEGNIILGQKSLGIRSKDNMDCFHSLTDNEMLNNFQATYYLSSDTETDYDC
jgi:hypothetical protein